MPRPVVSVVVPTRDRAGYLDVTLRSLAAQDLREPYELLVVDDGAAEGVAELAERAGARLVRPVGSGPNTARNAGTRMGAVIPSNTSPHARERAP